MNMQNVRQRIAEDNGTGVGNSVGINVGTAVGTAEGGAVGIWVGTLEGVPVGAVVGTCDGSTVGAAVGANVRQAEAPEADRPWGLVAYIITQFEEVSILEIFNSLCPNEAFSSSSSLEPSASVAV
jgi:hypothetical protein